MTRIIKASAVKPGMTIRWGRWDISYQCTLTRVERFNGGPGVQGETRQGKTVFLRGDDDVLVVKEPPQPEEPTEFGARVRTPNWRYVRGYTDGFAPWSREDSRVLSKWEDICAEGPVTVIDADPSWTAPADREPTPEVPERIEEWPENDAALRPHGWLDRLGSVWRYEHTGATTGWSCPGMSPQDQPWGSPFTRVTDA